MKTNTMVVKLLPPKSSNGLGANDLTRVGSGIKRGFVILLGDDQKCFSIIRLYGAFLWVLLHFSHFLVLLDGYSLLLCC